MSRCAPGPFEVGADDGRRVAVIGDVGGHLAALRAELARLGVPDAGAGPLPEDLTVVQVGDLVHRGPDSPGVVSLVDRHLRETPGRWVQLVGNHEALYLGERAFAWDERLAGEPVETLRRWWQEGAMVAAVAITAPEESLLVTHAGLTEEFWRRDLGGPPSARSAARRLNELIGTDEGLLNRPGHLLLGGRPRPGAGPLWAAAGTELIPGWSEVAVPFGQIHGHSSISDWADGASYADAAVLARTVLDPAARHEVTTLVGGRIIGIDPGHAADAYDHWRAWVIGTPIRSG